MRWPEPRPALPPIPRGRPGEARVLPDPFQPGFVWALACDAATMAQHRGAFELTLAAALTSLGCNRCLTLHLRTWSKAQAPIGRFVWSAPLTDASALRQLGALGRQADWHLIAVGPDDEVAAVHMRNTLDLPGLIRGAVGR